MNKVKGISCSEWIALVNLVKEKGPVCEEFQLLHSTYPINTSDSSESIIYKELAKLVTVLLNKAIKSYVKAINQSLEETDIEIAGLAFRKLKKSLKNCIYFTYIENYPGKVKKELLIQIEENICKFQTEFGLYLKKLSQYESSEYVEDLIYICKKYNLVNLVLECKNHA